ESEYIFHRDVSESYDDHKSIRFKLNLCFATHNGFNKIAFSSSLTLNNKECLNKNYLLSSDTLEMESLASFDLTLKTSYIDHPIVFNPKLIQEETNDKKLIKSIDELIF
ncbi:hypothetical protein HANVADRAFT_4620, partial [Hanseniaspora valbyensis NRRL Y-1626]